MSRRRLLSFPETAGVDLVVPPQDQERESRAWQGENGAAGDGIALTHDFARAEKIFLALTGLLTEWPGSIDPVVRPLHRKGPPMGVPSGDRSVSVQMCLRQVIDDEMRRFSLDHGCVCSRSPYSHLPLRRSSIHLCPPPQDHALFGCSHSWLHPSFRIFLSLDRPGIKIPS